MPPRHRAFTIHELIVVILILLVLIAILLPAISTGHGRNRMVRCASNLRQVGYAITLYSKDNRGTFPRTRASVEPAGGTQRVPVWGTAAAATQPFAKDGPADNDVTAGLFLLLRMPTIGLRPLVFVCPASNEVVDPLAGDGTLPPPKRSNFTDVKKHLSYSYQNVYPSNSIIGTGFLGQTFGTNYALVADKNPGAAGGNSMNHDLKGQNVLYADGHVSWQRTPLAGPVPKGATVPDNIYNTRDGRIIASPRSLFEDNILLPTD
jgi:prepilin-type processing-associated H-X9-DG protein